MFRSIRKNGALWGEGLTQNVISLTVDSRPLRSVPYHIPGGELEQIQFLLGHASVQTTERYLGCKQRIRQAVNDRIDVHLETHS